MKKTLIAGFMLLCSTGAWAQKIKVSESNEKIGDGSHNSLVVTIYEAVPEEIEKAWKSLMKDYDAKVSVKDGVFADNALFKQMGTNTVDVYARTEKGSANEVKFVVAFDLGGAYMSSSQHSQQYNVAKDMVENFAKKMTKESITDQLKAEQKIFNKLVSAEKDLVSDQENLSSDIVNWKEKIKKAEEEIVKKKADQEKKKQEIATQQKVLDAVILKQKSFD
jgi:hypothetical protein